MKTEKSRIRIESKQPEFLAWKSLKLYTTCDRGYLLSRRKPLGSPVPAHNRHTKDRPTLLRASLALITYCMDYSYLEPAAGVEPATF